MTALNRRQLNAGFGTHVNNVVQAQQGVLIQANEVRVGTDVAAHVHRRLHPLPILALQPPYGGIRQLHGFRHILQRKPLRLPRLPQGMPYALNALSFINHAAKPR